MLSCQWKCDQITTQIYNVRRKYGSYDKNGGWGITHSRR
jgi:hypothetical protein